MEPGTYPARIVQIASLGVQPQRPFKGEDKPPKLELLITYEMSDEFMKDEDGNDIEDKPRWVSEIFPFNNLEVDLAKSTKRYLALDPKQLHAGDWDKLIGTPCMVTIVINEGKGKNAGKFYEQVSGVSAMREKEAKKAPDLVNPPVVFDFYNPDPEAYSLLAKWVHKKLSEAVDFGGSAVEALAEGQPVKDKPKGRPSDDVDEDEIPW
jgi:hypothetical protein